MFQLAGVYVYIFTQFLCYKQDVIKGSFLSGVQLVWIQFSFSLTGCLMKSVLLFIQKWKSHEVKYQKPYLSECLRWDLMCNILWVIFWTVVLIFIVVSCNTNVLSRCLSEHRIDSTREIIFKVWSTVKHMLKYLGEVSSILTHMCISLLSKLMIMVTSSLALAWKVV